jgi:cytosine/adenosine deaminase-related metal-dependent hydrolase
MDDKRRVLHDTDLLITENQVSAIGYDLELKDQQDVQYIDGRNRIVYPGFINTHHHFYQSLTRNVPYIQNVKLFDWLVGLYPVWQGLDEEWVKVAARVAAAELLLSGCTTSADHFYVFPHDADNTLLDTEIDTAAAMGLRFHPTRGSMSRGHSKGGLPPDDVVQDADTILEDCQRVVERHHDPEPFSMCRIILAPCSPFSVTTDLMKASAQLAREKGVLLHTHLCETQDEEKYCIEKYGKRPLDYMEECGWTGNDVFYAHGIYFNDEEIDRLAETRTGIAHCPGSNLRLGSGICQVPRLVERGVKVSLAVDGSSSNDSGNYLREMQLALMIHRVGTAVDAMKPMRVLELATRGGAAVLGQPEIGQLAEGSAADLAVFGLDRVDYAGAMADPMAAPLMCGAGIRTDYTIVNGKIVVENGQVKNLDEERLFHQANDITRHVLETARQRTGNDYYQLR